MWKTLKEYNNNNNNNNNIYDRAGQGDPLGDMQEI